MNKSKGFREKALQSIKELKNSGQRRLQLAIAVRKNNN